MESEDERGRSAERGDEPVRVHAPVLLGETLEVLALAPGMVVIDATVGAGGPTTSSRWGSWRRSWLMSTMSRTIRAGRSGDRRDDQERVCAGDQVTLSMLGK